jgi:DNA repair exonuclease SbcCD ATPase subunit
MEKACSEKEELSNSLSQLEKESCLKSELNECFHKLRQKDEEIRQSRLVIIEQRESLENYEALCENLKEELARERQVVQKQCEFSDEVMSYVKSVYSFAAQVVTFSPGTGFAIPELIRELRPLFLTCHLPTFHFDHITPPRFAAMFSRLVSIRPNTDNEMLTSEHRRLLKDIIESLLDFPVDHEEIMSPGSMDSMEGKLNGITKMIGRVKTLFQDSEDSLRQLSSLALSQHSALKHMCQSPTHA